MLAEGHNQRVLKAVERANTTPMRLAIIEDDHTRRPLYIKRQLKPVPYILPTPGGQPLRKYPNHERSGGTTGLSSRNCFTRCAATPEELKPLGNFDRDRLQYSAVDVVRSINSSNIGTVNAVSPWLGLHTIPFRIRWDRVGARELTSRDITCAISPDRWGPPPSFAIAFRYLLSEGVSLSKRTRKKLWSRSAIA